MSETGNQVGYLKVLDPVSAEVPARGELWQHWEGKIYVIVRLALDSADHDQVVYEPVGGGPCKVLSLHQWMMIITTKAGRFRRYVRFPLPELVDDNPVGPTFEQRHHH